jgi:hypothetical protein
MRNDGVLTLNSIAMCSYSGPVRIRNGDCITLVDTTATDTPDISNQENDIVFSFIFYEPITQRVNTNTSEASTKKLSIRDRDAENNTNNEYDGSYKLRRT